MHLKYKIVIRQKLITRSMSNGKCFLLRKNINIGPNKSYVDVKINNKLFLKLKECEPQKFGSAVKTWIYENSSLKFSLN